MNTIFEFFLVFLLSLAFLPSNTIYAEIPSGEAPATLPTLVVTATRMETPFSESTAAVTVIEGRTLEEKKILTVFEALRTVPGLDVVQTGGPGGTASVFMRGANSAHTLVLIDGVQVNSPTLGQYNFSNLSTDNIERIEVIRGPQSTLYGSDAIGGVIQIFTKKGQGDFSGNVVFEGGAFDTHREGLRMQGAAKSLNYAVTLSRFDTKGFSKANAAAGNTEKDGHENTTFSSRVGFDLNPNAHLDWTLHYNNAEVDLDNSFPVMDDLNAVQENASWSSGLAFSAPLTARWGLKLQGLFQQEDSEGRDPDTVFNNFKIDTQRHQFDWQNNIALTDKHRLTAGYEYELQTGENQGNFDESIANQAGYALDQPRVLDLIVNLGLRFDDNNRFGNKTTYKTEAAYLFDQTHSKIRAAYGTGFHAPTLNDLYFPGFGNTALKPEESESYEIGLEQSGPDDVAYFNATYFHTEIDELIIFVVKDFNTFEGQAENVEKARVEGWEFETGWTPFQRLHLSANYSYTETKNRSTGAELARRPKHKAGGSVRIDASDRLLLIFDIRYVGARFNDTANLTRMPDYTVVDARASFQASEYIEVFGRIDNLLDREYEEVAGFGTPGFSAYGGLNIRF